MREGRYIYGIIAAKRNFDPTKICRDLYTVHYNDIAAVVGKSPTVRYEVTKERLLAHEHVLRGVLKDRVIVPMGFGIIADSDDDVKKILKTAYVEFKSALKKIDDKIQVDVRALWDANKIMADILGQDEEIRRLKETVAAKPPDESYDDKIELGKKVKLALDEKKDAYIKDIHDVLSELLDYPQDFRQNKLLDEKMIMNTSFLVPRGNEKAFYDKLDELEKKYGEQVEFRAAGPLPAYNFARVELRKMDFKTINDARKTLGLGEEATIAEIKSAYLDLTYRYHPDRNPGDVSAAERFKKIEKAYNTLVEYCEHYPYSFRKTEIGKTVIVDDKYG